MPRRRKTATPEETVSGPQQPDVVEQENLGGPGDLAPTGVSETEELPELSRQDQQAAIASPMGGTDQYTYVDRTAVPLHERNFSNMNSPLTEASQAELNPAFTAKAEDGGPANDKDESVGSEPNALELQADAAENQGGEEMRAQVEEQQAAATEQQMDVDAVNAAAEENAEGTDTDPGTGAGEMTPPGAPSGMEGSSDGEAGTAGATQ